MARSALRLAAPLSVDADLVVGCLNPEDQLDRRFALAWRDTLTALPPALRTGALPGVTGHVAESLVELILDDHGYVSLAHHVGPGRHGADLIMLHIASEMVFAVEVKGTLRPRHVPCLTRRELEQMSAAWIDKSDNPAMTSTQLRSDDLYGAVCAINFAEMTMRSSMSADFTTFSPVMTCEQLDEPSWLRRKDVA